MDKSLGYIKIRFITIFVLVIGHFLKSEFSHGQNALKHEPECEQTRKEKILPNLVNLMLQNNQNILLNDKIGWNLLKHLIKFSL